MSVQKALLSVIIPCYNQSEFLPFCIDSVLNQTYQNFEIIVVNDGSSDNFEEVISKCEGNEKIKIINKPNGGASSARNVGLNNARGDYITFLDSDDAINRNCLSILYEILIKNNCDFVAANFIRFNDEKQIDLNEEIIVDELISFEGINKYLSYEDGLYTSKIIPCAKLFKKTLFDNLKFIEGRYCEDEFIIHRLVDRANKYLYINSQIYYYRDNPNSVTNSNTSTKKHFDASDALFDRIAFLRKKHISLYDSSIERSIDHISLSLQRIKPTFKNFFKFQKRVSKLEFIKFEYYAFKNPFKAAIHLFLSLPFTYMILKTVKK